MRRRSLVLVLAVLGGCDAVQPDTPSLLVVEAFVTAEQPLPEIVLRRTASLREPYPLDLSTAATDAQLELRMQDMRIAYSMQDAGKYKPMEPVTAVPGAELGLKVHWDNQTVTAESQIPPPVSLDSAKISISDAPVLGLSLGSVFIDPFSADSLGMESFGTGAREELVYLVEATLYWTGGIGDNDWWMRTQLRPNLGQNQRLNNYFLSPEVIQPETDIPFVRVSQRSWSGAYAVPVKSTTDQVPAHKLRISLVRSTQAYASFVSGRSNPGEREPPSNILGGAGIFAGLAIDTLTIEIP